MTPEQRAANFSSLSAQAQFDIARENFNHGGYLTPAQAMLIDRAYGDGNGDLNQADLDKIEKERNSMGPLKMLGGATAAIFITDFFSRPDFRLGEGGALGTLFNSQASGTGPSPEPTLNPLLGLFTPRPENPAP